MAKPTLTLAEALDFAVLRLADLVISGTWSEHAGFELAYEVIGPFADHWDEVDVVLKAFEAHIHQPGLAHLAADCTEAGTERRRDFAQRLASHLVEFDLAINRGY